MKTMVFTTFLLAPLLMFFGVNHNTNERTNTDLSAKVRMNASSWECTATAQNEIEFIGDVTGGNAPYEINWYVSSTAKMKDAHQNETEYMEVSDVAEDFTPSPQISVSQPLGYYLIMHVKDAAGNTIEKTMKIDCNSLKVSAQVIEQRTK